MNLQSMSIIFVIIFLPIILISTYYIQREVDTIALQTSYDTKLIDATTDTVSAFEINTANEDLSSVSDSLRSMIEASNNVFINTLASNLGMSNATKSAILPYIPAIVYTLYDGYYIYSPTKQPKVVTDNYGVYVRVGDIGVVKSGNNYIYNYSAVESYNTSNDSEKKEPEKISYEDAKEDYHALLYFTKDEGTFNSDRMECTTDPNSAYKSTKYILKSFSPYSANYKNNNIDVTINYTLDNYITVYGTIEDKYYSKSGYLINTNNITKINFWDEENNLVYNKENFIYGKDNYIGIEEIDDLVNRSSEVSIEINDITINKTDDSAESEYYDGSKIKDNISAIKYYLKAYTFSTWVNATLNELVEDDFQNVYNSNNFETKYNIDDNIQTDNKLFEEIKGTKHFFGNAIDYENSGEKNENPFLEHKSKVIKNAIQYNLNQAMATYNNGKGDKFYQMPVLTEEEWDKLLSNVSVLAFMQGLPCGLKTYNNYAIVTSRNNEIMTNIDHIYYIPIQKDNDGVKIESDEKEDFVLDTAHFIDCEKLYDEVELNNEIYFESFSSRELKYDKVYDSNSRKYVYDHVCNTCYYCIVNSNYTSLSEKNNKLSDEQKNKYDYKKSIMKKAELISIGKIRNNTYKMSTVQTNYGLYIDNNPNKQFKKENYNSIELDLQNCYEIEITIKNKLTNTGNISKVSYSNLVNDISFVSNGDQVQKQSYNIATDKTFTFKFTDDGTWNNRVNFKIDINKNIGSIGYSADVVSITYKYK